MTSFDPAMGLRFSVYVLADDGVSCNCLSAINRMAGF